MADGPTRVIPHRRLESVEVERRHRTGGWRSLAVLGAFGIACGSAFAMVYVLTVRTTTGRLLGEASLKGAILTNSRVGQVVDQVLNVVSLASLLGAGAVIAVIALIRLRRALGLAAIGLLIGANTSTRLLKDYVLSRPDLGLRESTPATLNSLPSGHSAAAFSVVVATLFVLPPRWRVTVSVGGVAYATVTGLATMSAGWHRPADSVAAFLLVGVWAAIAGVCVVVFAGSGSGAAHPQIDRHSRGWLTVLAVGALALGMSVVLAMVVHPPFRESHLGPSAAFLAGGLLVAGTAAAVLAAILAVLDRIAPFSP